MESAMSEVKQPYIWEQSYPDDIDWHAPLTPETMSAMMDEAARKYAALPAIDFLGQMVGAVYTEDMLDRIFSRFCIGK